MIKVINTIVTIIVASLVVAALLSLFGAHVAKADGFYLDTQLSVRRAYSQYPTTIYKMDDEHTFTLTTFRPYDVNITRNPYGGIAFGYCKDTKLFSVPIQWDVKVLHDSSLDTTADRGITSFNVGMRIWLFQ